jgi:hypothetical protein
MIEKINLNNFFLDIETVPEVADFNELDADMQVLYEQKSNTSVKTISQLRFYDRAGIWAELEKLFVYLLAILSLKVMFAIFVSLLWRRA